MSQTLAVRTATMADGHASRGQQLAAITTMVIGLLLTLGVLPYAPAVGPAIPGFLLLHQTALIVIYAFGSWMLFAQYRRGGLATLLVAGGGMLFSTAIVTLQLASMPGTLAPGRLLGGSSSTTTWLWTAWHLGPPVWGLAVAAILLVDRNMLIPTRRRRQAALIAIGAALLLAGTCACVATVALPYLPLQVVGDDYTAMIHSGIGPGLVLLTIAALVTMILVTLRQRSMLEVWIIVSLALLVLDNWLTLAGAARGTVGWVAGRLVALVSAGAAIWAYLREAESLRAHAETAFAELATTQGKLHEAQRMEAVGQLTGAIAHDFNNLLMVITNSFDVIRRHPADPENITKIAEAGLLATERGARLTRHLLTYARRQVLRPAAVSPNAQLTALEPAVRRLVGERLGFTLALDEAAYAVMMDTAEFDAAVMNLVANARDTLLDKGGTIAISSRNQKRTEPGATDHLPAGDYTVVAVADNGSGMTPGVVARAFEPFFTTKDFGDGAGLGLSQVHGFARASGGDAIIHTTPGFGTQVELWLPRSATQPETRPSETQNIRAPLRHAHEGEVVLAVEDEPDVLSVVAENLVDLGYEVLTARDAAEALELIRMVPRLDLLFSDIVMPGGMNGVQLANEATRLRPGIRILLTSGYSNLSFEGPDALPPHLAVLPKPYRRAELANRLDQVMHAA
jgi:signal transduction histidine kinase/CheY-like chemotaxis protein